MPIQRYHALDALRAAMMLLGLVLHSAASYTQTPLGAAWPYHDRQTSVVFDLTIFFIHLFRMPVFFVVAGFFAALLYHRDGPRGLARNRAKRVAVPLLLFWPIVPLVGLGFVWSLRQSGGDMPWGEITRIPVYEQPILGHLWFLYYLLVFYAGALLVVPFVARRWPQLGVRAGTFARVASVSWWGPVALSVVTTLTMLPMDAPGLDTAPSLLPAARVLVAYAVFFTVGWLLFGEREVIDAIGRRWLAPLAIGVAASLVYLFVVVAQAGFTSARVWHATAVPFAALAIWHLIFGITGLFVRFLSEPRPTVRYFSDASYWMYIMHAPLTSWLPGVLARSATPAAVKFAFVIGTTTLVTVATYHLFVRSTVVGELLNGRRYARVIMS